MQWRVVVLVLDVQDLLQQVSSVDTELRGNPLEVAWVQQVLELLKHISVLAWIEPRLLLSVEVLHRREELAEVEARCTDLVQLDGEHGLEGLVALGELAHGAIVQRRSAVLILKLQNLPILVQDVTGVLIEKILHTDDEVLEAVNQVSILVDRAVEGAVLHVHVFKSGGVLLFKDLVEQRLLEVGSLEAQDGYQTFVVAAIDHVVVHVTAIVVDVNLLHDDVLGRAHLCYEVNSNVLKAEIAVVWLYCVNLPCEVEGSAPICVPFEQQLHDLVLRLLSGHRHRVVVVARVEPLHDVREVAAIDVEEDAFAAAEGVLLKADGLVD